MPRTPDVPDRRTRRVVRAALVIACLAGAAVSLWAEWPPAAQVTRVGPAASAGVVRIIVHTGRSDMAWRVGRQVAEGLAEIGVSSVLASTSADEARPDASDRGIVLVAPTYWWAPAWTIGRWTSTHRLTLDVPLLPIVTASGQGGRALRLLRARAEQTGARVLPGHALFTMRPNDAEAARGGDNRVAADRIAREAGRAFARHVVP